LALSIGGATVVDAASPAVQAIAARGPVGFSARVGPLQARGDTPATNATIDNVLVTKD
jgi:hypothetical protein